MFVCLFVAMYLCLPVCNHMSGTQTKEVQIAGMQEVKAIAVHIKTFAWLDFALR